MIKVINQLNSQELAAAKVLIGACQEYDGSHREPYLSNRLNFDLNMPAFFLYYEEGELLGLLTVYADDDEAELAILVHPNHRRQGIGRQLYRAFQEQTKFYPISSVTFQTERVFLKKNPDFAANLGLVESSDTETWMGRNRELYQLSQRIDVTVCLADTEHLEEIAELQAKTFHEEDEGLEIPLRYAKQALENDDSLLYVLLKDGQVVASCTVDLSSANNYLYGLAVCENLQGQGLGSYLVKTIVNELIKVNDKSFQIAVEDANVGAKKLYEKIGFVVQTQVVYLDCEE